ncbi:hypothetical protein ANCCEY_15133 [Ancylostoma ceylanicum]|uniref:Uncharacterized protein n=1 Tax=Ancylostoma ceylanicum TaxID=53326 RepID=A0A0D6L417_9BILA|nr:hypothetical protein ANCCEY_15133 [Ancylostoma ceylanicum]
MQSAINRVIMSTAIFPGEHAFNAGRILDVVDVLVVLDVPDVLAALVFLRLPLSHCLLGTIAISRLIIYHLLIGDDLRMPRRRWRTRFVGFRALHTLSTLAAMPSCYVYNIHQCSKGRFPIDIRSVQSDHEFLGPDSLRALYRRLNTLNRCAIMRIDQVVLRRRGTKSQNFDHFWILWNDDYSYGMYDGFDDDDSVSYQQLVQ